jgi:hypothetical protein
MRLDPESQERVDKLHMLALEAERKAQAEREAELAKGNRAHRRKLAAQERRRR